MKKITTMKKIVIILIVLVLILSVFALISGNSNSSREIQSVPISNNIVSDSQEVVEERKTRIEEKAKEALSFCETNDCNTDFCILIDMKIHSGKYRMFVYDFKDQKVERKALVTHGSGKDDKKSTGAEPLFGNEEGSLLTSLGKYTIGDSAYSRWGINVHYKLHGLDTSNSNAFKRIIVLHSYTPVPSYEIYPRHLPMGWSWGCPVTDDRTMAWLDSKLRDVKKPVLLWIYY